MDDPVMTGPGAREPTGPGAREPTGPGAREPRPRPLLRTTLGEVLRRARLERRRTLADVARAARVSLPYLSEVERGRKEASSEVLAAICDALRIELSDVLAEAGRDLAGHRARRAQVIRLAAIRGGRVAPQVRGPSDPHVRGPDRSQAGGPGDVVCLLAA